MEERNNQRRLLVIGGAAVLAAGVGGYFAGRALDDGAAPADAHGEGEAHAEGEEAEGEGGEGFVRLNAEEAAAAGIEVATVTQGGGGELLVPGRVSFAPGADAPVGAPLAGIVSAVHVGPGAAVGAGTPLATLSSSEGAALRAAADTARAEDEAADAAYRRETRLFNERVTARQDLEAARAARLRAAASLRAARAQVDAVGSPDSRGRVVVRAPMAGTVTRLAAAPGAVLAQGGEIAQVADQGRVELQFDAPAAASRAVRIGTAIYATSAGGQEVRAVVTAISPNVGNAGAQLRARPVGFVPPAGTPVSGRVLTNATPTPTVPSDAVQAVEGRPAVFVAVQGGFRARPVVTGRVAGGRTEILRGLAQGERVAARGAFVLKAELSRGEAEHAH